MWSDKTRSGGGKKVHSMVAKGKIPFYLLPYKIQLARRGDQCMVNSRIDLLNFLLSLGHHVWFLCVLGDRLTD